MADAGRPTPASLHVAFVQLYGAAMAVLLSHQGEDGWCVVCGEHWPCASACLADSALVLVSARP